MDRQTIVINGDNFLDIESFYVEIDRVFTRNLDWETGHNLNAFIDLLCGGFGVFEYDELVNVIWTSFSKSRSGLGQEMVDILTNIIKEHKHIDFKVIE